MGMSSRAQGHRRPKQEPDLEVRPLATRFSWTPHALCCVSWEVLHLHGACQGTDMGLDIVVGLPKQELEHLSH